MENLEQVDINTNTSEFASAVWNELMQPDQRNRLTDLLSARQKWKKAQNWTEGISQTFFLIATILAFSAYYWDTKLLSFLAGAVGGTGTGLFGFSKYAGSESSERSINLTRTWVEIRSGPSYNTFQSNNPDLENDTSADNPSIQAD